MVKILRLHQYFQHLLSSQCKLFYVISLSFRRKVPAERHQMSDACSFSCDIRLTDPLSATRPLRRAFSSLDLATLLGSYGPAYENFASTSRAIQVDYYRLQQR